MSHISTHILDTSLGRPASEVLVQLDALNQDSQWIQLSHGQTDANGRLQFDSLLEPGVYRLHFHAADYFARSGTETFYPKIEIQFQIKDATQKHHVPLLLNPFGFSTYRGQ